jgi:hypothetical protein
MGTESRHDDLAKFFRRVGPESACDAARNVIAAAAFASPSSTRARAATVGSWVCSRWWWRGSELRPGWVATGRAGFLAISCAPSRLRDLNSVFSEMARILPLDP